MKTKWPGLIPLAGRIIAFPFALVIGGIKVIAFAVFDGVEWWLERMAKR